ncbi:hypothetical protein EBR03_06990 [bacterium]|nr:hypothetical protein [bacterium]NBX82464.1 hypothetical protein [bacterium]
MKYVLWITTLFSLSLLSWGDTVDELNEISNNAYVKLYEQWVALDHNQVTRLELIKENAHIELVRGEKLAQQKVITADELEDLQLKYKLALVTLERQQLKIKESEARLSIVKSKVAAGMTDIPICVRPMDIP